VPLVDPGARDAFLYSITSSARARSVGGTFSPSPSAALKLNTPTEFWAAASGGAAKPADVDILAFRPASLLETSPEGHDVIRR
jgi:hypothetical protein